MTATESNAAKASKPRRPETSESTGSRASKPATSQRERPPVGVTLLAGAVTALVVVPVLWILVVAASVDVERAVALLFREKTLEIFLNTVGLVIGVTLFSILLAVPLACLTELTDLPYSKFWAVIISLPLVIPSYIGAFSYISVWGPQGEIQSLLEPLGVESLPDLYGLPGAIFILTLYNYPYVYITTRAGLQSFDKTYLDAARSLDQQTWRSFLRAVIPFVRPAMTAGALLVALYAIGDFGTPSMLRLDVFTRVIYVEYNTFGQEYASLLAMNLVVVALVILAIESNLRGSDTLHGTLRGETRNYVYELGRWRWVAVACCVGLAVVTLLFPVAVLTMWLFRQPDVYAPALEFDWSYAVNSVAVSGGAAVVAAVAAIPIAYLSARYSSRLVALFERASYIGYAVPGIVIGLSLIYFSTHHAAFAYQTLPLIVFAYVVLYLPQAVGPIRTGVLHVNPRLVEAARSLGCTPWRAFRTVVFPLIIPGLIAGGALVFLTAMKELPATLLLGPAGFETLATFIWRLERNALYGFAALPALVLIAVSGLSMLLVVFRDRYDRRIGQTNAVDSSDSKRAVPPQKVTTDGGERYSPSNRQLGDETILELDGISKSFGAESAVTEFSVAVSEGELLTLVGPSGCGKTTTLRLIAGLETPDSGTVRIRGEEMATADHSMPIEQRNVGIVFQDFALFPHKTVAENVAFGLWEDSPVQREERVEELLALVGLDDYGEQYPASLSGGQKQRVALARSLAPEPDLLLLDEPLSNLDVSLRVEMRETVRSILAETGVTAIWVTHDQEEALSIGDRVGVMDNGTLEQIGAPDTVFLQPASRTVAEFLGEASYLPGERRNGVFETPVGTVAASQVIGEPSTSVELLVRPDDLSLSATTAETADGVVRYRRFNGPTVSYRIQLTSGEEIRCTHSHDELLERGTPVAVEIVAGHQLPAFPAGKPK